MRNTNEIIHQWIKEHVQSEWLTVDMTCGHGRDTLQLAKHSAHVYSIDIQAQAIESAKELCKDYENITFINDDHTLINQYIPQFVHLAIFNLGYLPGGKKSIKTNKDSTLVALGKIYPRLRKNGYLIITCYPGHPGGKEEHEVVKRWLNHFKNFEVTTYDYGKDSAPITYICKKISFDSR